MSHSITLLWARALQDVCLQIAQRQPRYSRVFAGGRRQRPLAILHVPAGWAATFGNSEFDWSFQTEPEPELNDRQVLWPRGKVSWQLQAINGMIYVRGCLWTLAWNSGAKVVLGRFCPTTKKAEKQQVHRDDMHGTDGPLH